MLRLTALSPDLLRYFAMFQGNKSLVGYLCTCKILHKQRIRCTLLEPVNYAQLQNVLFQGFFVSKVIVKSAHANDSLNPALLQGVKWISIVNANTSPYYPTGFRPRHFIPKLPNSISGVTLSFNPRLLCLDFGFLPTKLARLKLGAGFNQSLLFSKLPAALTHLRFGDEFNMRLFSAVLPNSITHLHFGSRFSSELTAQNLPTQLQRLTRTNLSYSYDDFSQQKYLTHLSLNCPAEQAISNLRLPPSLTHLSLGVHFNSSLQDLPNHIISVKIAVNVAYEHYEMIALSRVHFY